MPLEFYHHTQRKFIIRPVESPDKRFCIIYTLPCGWSWSETSHPVGKNDFRTALPSASACVTETKFPDESFLSPLLEWVFVGVVVLGSILFLLLVGICWCQCCPHSCCCYVRCCCCPDTCCCPKHCEYTNTHTCILHMLYVFTGWKKKPILFCLLSIWGREDGKEWPTSSDCHVSTLLCSWCACGFCGPSSRSIHHWTQVIYSTSFSRKQYSWR